MSEKSEPTTLSESMSSVEDSHVKTYLSQVNRPASRENVAVYGYTLPASLASFDPDTLSWRTSQRSFIGGWVEFSETWPRAGMMQCGTVYRRHPSAPLTDVIECSWLPTPTAAQFTQNKSKGETAKVRLSLHGMAKKGMWPTPTVKGNHNRKGLSSTSGNGLLTEVGPGPLNPRWVEWLMGFPEGWTKLEL